MNKYFRTPFAENGDTEEVPDDATGTLVSYDQGYTPAYELDPDTDPSGNYVGRQRMNQLFKDITENIKTWQENMFPEWVSDSDGSGTPFAYKEGAVVLYTDGSNYISTIDSNTGEPTISLGWDLFTFSSGNELPIVTGTASFDNATQAISMTGVGAINGLEIGDVIRTENSISNDRLATIEGITDNDEVIVNYEHRGQTTTMSLVDETSTGGVVISLLSKWYNTPPALGRDWCEPTSDRSIGVTYAAPINRGMSVIIPQIYLNDELSIIEINSLSMTQSSTRGDDIGVSYAGAEIPANADYLVPTGGGRGILGWYELR